jgi:hypothetical protein
MLQSVEQRIERVINNLLPMAVLEGKFGPPKNLYERLADYRIPGISIAVSMILKLNGRVVLGSAKLEQLLK